MKKSRHTTRKTIPVRKSSTQSKREKLQTQEENSVTVYKSKEELRDAIKKIYKEAKEERKNTSDQQIPSEITHLFKNQLTIAIKGSPSHKYTIDKLDFTDAKDRLTKQESSDFVRYLLVVLQYIKQLKELRLTSTFKSGTYETLNVHLGPYSDEGLGEQSIHNPESTFNCRTVRMVSWFIGFRNLQVLHLGNNALCFTDYKTIMKGLEKNSAIQELSLEGNSEIFKEYCLVFFFTSKKRVHFPSALLDQVNFKNLVTLDLSKTGLLSYGFHSGDWVKYQPACRVPNNNGGKFEDYEGKYDIYLDDLYRDPRPILSWDCEMETLPYGFTKYGELKERPTSIKTLKLANNRFSDSYSVYNITKTLILMKHTLTNLDLSNTHLPRTGMHHLLSALADNTTLKVLNLENAVDDGFWLNRRAKNNGLIGKEDDWTLALPQVISNNMTLRALNVAKNTCTTPAELNGHFEEPHDIFRNAIKAAVQKRQKKEDATTLYLDLRVTFKNGKERKNVYLSNYKDNLKHFASLVLVSPKAPWDKIVKAITNPTDTSENNLLDGDDSKSHKNLTHSEDNHSQDQTHLARLLRPKLKALARQDHLRNLFNKTPLYRTFYDTLVAKTSNYVLGTRVVTSGLVVKRSQTVMEIIEDKGLNALNAVLKLVDWINPLFSLTRTTIETVGTGLDFAYKSGDAILSTFISYNQAGFFGCRYTSDTKYQTQEENNLNLFFQFEASVIERVSLAYPTTAKAEHICRHVAFVIVNHIKKHPDLFKIKLGEDLFQKNIKWRRLADQLVSYLIAAIRQIANNTQEQPKDDLTWVIKILKVAFQDTQNPKDAILSRLWDAIKSKLSKDQLSRKDLNDLFSPTYLKLDALKLAPLPQSMQSELKALDAIINSFSKLKGQVKKNTKAVNKQKRRSDDHEQRLVELEKKHSTTSPGAQHKSDTSPDKQPTDRQRTLSL